MEEDEASTLDLVGEVFEVLIGAVAHDQALRTGRVGGLSCQAIMSSS